MTSSPSRKAESTMFSLVDFLHGPPQFCGLFRGQIANLELHVICLVLSVSGPFNKLSLYSEQSPWSSTKSVSRQGK
jgi:hypothetical protein